jgi:hypothetical protein
MEQSSANENMITGNNEIIEEFMNDVIMEDKFEENASVQHKQEGIQKMPLKN